MPKLILASSSVYRQRLMKNAGLVFSSIAPQIDEDLIKSTLIHDNVRPQDIAIELAVQKSRKVSAKNPESYVIGSDQILEFNGNIISKSPTPEDLKQLLSKLSGETHYLHTATVISRNSMPIWRHFGKATLSMRTLSRSEIDAYVDESWDQVQNSVGGYHIESKGIQLFSHVEGDMFEIQGLSLVPVLNQLRILEAI